MKTILVEIVRTDGRSAFVNPAIVSSVEPTNDRPGLTSVFSLGREIRTKESMESLLERLDFEIVSKSARPPNPPTPKKSAAEKEIGIDDDSFELGTK